MVRLKRGNFIALLLFLFPPRRHSGRCVITGDLLPPCERLSSPTSPGSNYSSTQGLVGHECVYMAEFSGVFLTPLLPLLLLLWFRTRQIPSSCEFLHRLEFSLNNRTLNTITHRPLVHACFYCLLLWIYFESRIRASRSVCSLHTRCGFNFELRLHDRCVCGAFAYCSHRPRCFFPTFLHTLNYMHLCVLCSCLAVFEQPEVDYFPIVTLPNGCESSYITYFPDNYNILLINDQHFLSVYSYN